MIRVLEQNLSEIRESAIKNKQGWMFEMKFYEFNEYEYYALIGADNKENAKLGYTEVVADIKDNERGLTPNIIHKEDALKRYAKATVEGCKTVEDKMKDFNKQINSFNDYVSKGSEPYMVFLVDGSLY